MSNNNNNSFKSKLPRLLSLKKKRGSAKRSTSTATSSMSAAEDDTNVEAAELGTLSSSSINNNSSNRHANAAIAEGEGGAERRSQKSFVTAGSENVFFQFSSTGRAEKTSADNMEKHRHVPPTNSNNTTEAVRNSADDNDFVLHYAVQHDEPSSPAATPHFMTFFPDGGGGGGGDLIGECSTTTFHDGSSMLLRIIQPVAAAATIDECVTAKVKVVSSPIHSTTSSSSTTTTTTAKPLPPPQKLEFSKAVPVRVLNYFWSRGKRSAASFRNRSSGNKSPQPSSTFDADDNSSSNTNLLLHPAYRSLQSQTSVFDETTTKSIEVENNSQASFGSSFEHDHTIRDIDDEDSSISDNNNVMTTTGDNIHITVPKPVESDIGLKTLKHHSPMRLVVSPPQRRRAADAVLPTTVVPPAPVSPLTRSPTPTQTVDIHSTQSPRQDSSTSATTKLQLAAPAAAARRKPLHKWIASSFHKLSRADSNEAASESAAVESSHTPVEKRKPPSHPSLKFRQNSETNSVVGSSSIVSGSSKTTTANTGSVGRADSTSGRRISSSSSGQPPSDVVSETNVNVFSSASSPHHHQQPQSPATAAVISSSAKKSAHRFFFRSGRASKVFASNGGGGGGGGGSSGSSPPTPVRSNSGTAINAAPSSSSQPSGYHQFKHSPLSPIPSNEPLSTHSTLTDSERQQQEAEVAEIGLDFVKSDDSHHNAVVTSTSTTTVISSVSAATTGDVNSPSNAQPHPRTVSPLAAAANSTATTTTTRPRIFSFPSRSNSNQNSSEYSVQIDNNSTPQPASGIIPPPPPSPSPSSALAQLSNRPQKAKSLDDEAVETRARSSTTTTTSFPKPHLRAKTIISSSKTSHHRHHNSSPLGSGGKVTPFVAALAKRLTGGSSSSSTSNIYSPEPNLASPSSPQPPPPPQSAQPQSRSFLSQKSSTPPGQIKTSSPPPTAANVPSPDEMLTTKKSSSNMLLGTAAVTGSDNVNTVGNGDLASANSPSPSALQRRVSNVGGARHGAAGNAETTDSNHFSLSADNATLPTELATAATAADDDGNKPGSVSVDNNDPAPPEKPKNPQEAAKVMRDYKILELVQTEKDYVDDLRKIVEGYIEEMKQHPPPDDMQGKEKIIFGNVAQIFEWHRDTFSKQIEQNAQQPDKLAQLFERHFRRLLMYVTYCQNKPKSDCVVSDYMDTYFEELRKRLGHRLTLSDLLIKPVQRPMRYELLLKEMAKYTARAGLDAAPFEKAIDLISQGICKLVDDSMEVGRLSGFDGNLNAQGKLLLQDTFQVADASLLTPQLHATATTSLVPSPSSGGHSSSRSSSTHQRIDSSKCDERLKFQERRLFLFEQILIVSEVQYIGAHNAPSGKQLPSNLVKAFYIYKDHIQVNKLSLTDDQASHRFVVLMRDPHAGEKCYVVNAGDDAKRDLWVTKIRQMLDTQTNFLRALQSPIDFQRRTQSFM